ncbi:hypothetical protein FE257_005380 [Aspergillus nanangensis]|uniref:Uncharacterized protein n=1 Tax=Aspergillus nanangensis TaxID=2582783 RepID=A0AAD4CQF4_ASPNN|nr:hypothetical protein FE257_005380 [Aspergillus nanangensis]
MRYSSVPVAYTLTLTSLFGLSIQQTTTQCFNVANLRSQIASLSDLFPTLTAPPTGAQATLLDNIRTLSATGPFDPSKTKAAKTGGLYQQWYDSLPTDVQSYFSEYAPGMTDVCVTYDAHGPRVTDPSAGTEDRNGAAESSTSEALGARPTGPVVGGLVLALGVLGTAVIL